MKPSDSDRGTPSIPEQDDTDDLLAESDAFEVEEEDDDQDSGLDLSPEPPLRRGPLGAWLVGMGGGAWLFFAAMRCSPPPAGPELAMENPPAPEPAVEREHEPQAEPQREPNPDPRADKRAPADESPPTTAEEPDIIEAVPARPKPAAWASDIHAPQTVSYMIQRGGAIKNVANLFKIYHHEITALNPGIELDHDLPPKSKVVVYRQESGERSESVGLPSSGTLEGGVPMLAGPGRILKMIPWKSWGTGTTVATLDRVLEQWAKRGSPQPILVGNLSSRHGGPLEPHSTHQSGRDVDLSYPQKMRPGEELNWREMSTDNLDAAETWALLFLLVQTGAIEAMFMDRSLQKILYDHALEHRLMSKRQLSEWLEYPRPTGSGNPVVQHVKGHIDHLHVRFECQPHESRCVSRDH